MDKRKKWLLTSVLAIQILIFYSFCYGDMLITLMHGLRFWDCLFFDNIRNFYSYCQDAPLAAGMYSGTYSPAYDFLIYIIFAVWEFPLWVGQHFFGVENILDTLPGVMWGKSIMIPFIILLAVMLRKIWSSTGMAEHIQRKTLLLFLTSVLFTTYVCIVGQYDVIPLAVMMLGIYFFCHKKRALFVVIFALAIPIKMFSFLPFWVLLLYAEKNILRIFADVMCSLCPTVILRILVPFSDVSNTSVFIPALFVNKTPLSYSGVYIFLIAFVMLCFFSYLKKPAEDMEQFGRDVAYFCLLSFAIVLVLGYTLPYWFFYLAPFMYWVIGNCWENHTVNLLAELGISFFAVISHAMAFYWVFSAPIAGSSMLLSALLRGRENRFGSLPSLVGHLLGEQASNLYAELIAPVFMSLSIACLIVFLAINNPRRAHAAAPWRNDTTEHTMYLLRLVLAYAICLIPLSGYFLH